MRTSPVGQGRSGSERSERNAGAAYALAAFGLWGMFPVYFKLVSAVPALELLAHRIAWTLVIVLGLLMVLGRVRVTLARLRDRRLMLVLLASSAIVGVNWGVFMWAVINGYVLQSSLGYYINPLVNVLFGVMFLNERLSTAQWIAVGLAVLGVLNLVVGAGEFPWIALTLAFTFGIYGLIRKVASIDAIGGLFFESLVLALPGVVYIGYLAVTGAGAFGQSGLAFDLLIIASGVVTAAPLICFTQAARRLRLATVGVFQYFSPTCHFMLAVFAFGEDFGASHMITFALIWLACGLYTWDSLRQTRSTLGT